MFIHAVLFKIEPKQLSYYKNDCKMWASFARKAKGFIAYYTLKRAGYKNQYTSVYKWKAKKFHDAFMGKLHDWLVSRSKAKVEVLGYYNLSSIQEVK